MVIGFQTGAASVVESVGVLNVTVMLLKGELARGVGVELTLRFESNTATPGINTMFVSVLVLFMKVSIYIYVHSQCKGFCTEGEAIQNHFDLINPPAHQFVW